LTDAGIQIDDSDEQPEKARNSIRESFDGVSNTTSWRERQNAKQSEPRSSTPFGTRTDDSDEQ
jgi:hypothetical protein